MGFSFCPHADLCFTVYTPLMCALCDCCSVVPRGANNVYSMPVDVTLWGQPDTKAEVLSTVRQHGYIVYDGLSQVPVNSASAASSSYNNWSANVPARRTFLNPTEVIFLHSECCSFVFMI